MGRVLLLGHRGAASATSPENTVAAVERAFRAGADGVEVDVRLTRDGRVVCLHDPSLRRVAGLPDDLAALTAAEAAAVRLPGGHPLPSLDEVVVVARGRGRLVVEVKTEPAGWRTAAVTVAGRLARLGVTRRTEVVVSSFDRRALGVVRDTGVARTAVLGAPGVPTADVVGWALREGHDEAHPHVRALLAAAPSLVAGAHALGVALTAWTANAPDDLRRLAARGVDAAICDDPRAARAALAPTPLGPRR